MKYATGINTVPSRLREPLQNTKMSLAEGGFAVDHILVDHEHNPYAAFRLLLTRLVNTGADILFTFQDDIEIASHTLEYLLSDLLVWTDGSLLGLRSLYTSSRNDREEFGWRTVPCRHADGALGYVWPIEIARLFLKDPPHPDRTTMIDHWVGTFCKNNKIPYWCHSPSFIKHVDGIPSTINGGGMVEFRQCKRWIKTFKPYEVEVL